MSLKGSQPSTSSPERRPSAQNCPFVLSRAPIEDLLFPPDSGLEAGSRGEWPAANGSAEARVRVDEGQGRRNLGPG